MNNTETVKHMIKILEAFVDNKEIQHRHDNGEVGGLWYDGPGPKSPIPNFLLYEYRIKPVYKKYRVGLFMEKDYYTLTASDDETADGWYHNDPNFIKWISDWVKYDVS